MKKRTAKEILAETLLELAKEQPIDKITVKKIVEESGLSLQTFYNHFTDKSALVLWIHKSFGDRLIEKFINGEKTFHELNLDNLKFYYDHRQFMQNALTNTHGQESYAKQSADNAYRVLSNYINIRQGWTELPEECRILLKLYIYGTIQAYADWAMREKDISIETFASYMENALPEKLKVLLL